MAKQAHDVQALFADSGRLTGVLGYSTMLRLLREGHVKGSKVGRKWVITQAELEWFESVLTGECGPMQFKAADGTVILTISETHNVL